MATIRKLRGRWQAMVRRKGMQPRSKSFDSKSDVERWARSLEAEVDRCGALPDTRTAEKMTLGDIISRYLEEITPTKRSAQSEGARLRATLRQPICYRTMTLLSSQDLARYRDERLSEAAPATVIRELNTISHAIDTARREWGLYLPTNPCTLVKRPKPPRGRDRRLQGDEEQKLLDAADKGRNPYMKPLIVIAIETGMRRGEILGLRWDDVDFERRLAHLETTKNGDSRDVPLSRRAVETIEALPRNDERVIPRSGNAARLAWEKLRRRAGLEDLHLHDLRHEAVSRLFERGLNVIEVSTISGHKEIKMLQRYAHLKAEDLVARLD